jgi:hypothetical protein
MSRTEPVYAQADLNEAEAIARVDTLAHGPTGGVWISHLDQAALQLVADLARTRKD